MSEPKLTSLSCVATSVLRMRLLHVVAFPKKLRWLAQTKYFENTTSCSKRTLKTTVATLSLNQESDNSGTLNFRPTKQEMCLRGADNV